MRFITDKYDRFWELLSLIFLLCNAAMIVFTLPSLPEIIPIHFNGEGEANGFGNKLTLWLIFIFAGVFYTLMTVISLHPGLYRWRMTARNIGEQYRLTSQQGRVIKAVFMFWFAALTLFMLKSARGQWTEYFPVLFLILLLTLFPVIIYYLIKFSKIR